MHRGDEPTADPSAPPNADGVVSEDTGNTDFVPGRFIYQFNSITAQATFDGSVATVNIRNGTSGRARRSRALRAGDRRPPVRRHRRGRDRRSRQGEQVTLEFAFPDEVTPQSIGLAVLQFGDDNVGAMAPVPRGGRLIRAPAACTA